MSTNLIQPPLRPRYANEGQPPSISILPNEILVAIFDFLNTQELFKVTDVCYHWRWLAPQATPLKQFFFERTGLSSYPPTCNEKPIFPLVAFSRDLKNLQSTKEIRSSHKKSFLTKYTNYPGESFILKPFMGMCVLNREKIAFINENNWMTPNHSFLRFQNPLVIYFPNPYCLEVMDLITEETMTKDLSSAKDWDIQSSYYFRNHNFINGMSWVGTYKNKLILLTEHGLVISFVKQNDNLDVEKCSFAEGAFDEKKVLLDFYEHSNNWWLYSNKVFYFQSYLMIYQGDESQTTYNTKDPDAKEYIYNIEKNCWINVDRQVTQELSIRHFLLDNQDGIFCELIDQGKQIHFASLYLQDEKFKIKWILDPSIHVKMECSQNLPILLDEKYLILREQKHAMPTPIILLNAKDGTVAHQLTISYPKVDILYTPSHGELLVAYGCIDENNSNTNVEVIRLHTKEKITFTLKDLEAGDSIQNVTNNLHYLLFITAKGLLIMKELDPFHVLAPPLERAVIFPKTADQPISQSQETNEGQKPNLDQTINQIAANVLSNPPSNPSSAFSKAVYPKIKDFFFSLVSSASSTSYGECSHTPFSVLPTAIHKTKQKLSEGSFSSNNSLSFFQQKETPNPYSKHTQTSLENNKNTQRESYLLPTEVDVPKVVDLPTRLLAKNGVFQGISKESQIGLETLGNRFLNNLDMAFSEGEKQLDTSEGAKGFLQEGKYSQKKRFPSLSQGHYISFSKHLPTSFSEGEYLLPLHQEKELEPIPMPLKEKKSIQQIPLSSLSPKKLIVSPKERQFSPQFSSIFQEINNKKVFFPPWSSMNMKGTQRDFKKY
jgi:hypothetical protein